jgi:hypothetical protein
MLASEISLVPRKVLRNVVWMMHYVSSKMKYNIYLISISLCLTTKVRSVKFYLFCVAAFWLLLGANI